MKISYSWSTCPLHFSLAKFHSFPVGIDTRFERSLAFENGFGQEKFHSSLFIVVLTSGSGWNGFKGNLLFTSRQLEHFSVKLSMNQWEQMEEVKQSVCNIGSIELRKLISSSHIGNLVRIVPLVLSHLQLISFRKWKAVSCFISRREREKFVGYSCAIKWFVRKFWTESHLCHLAHPHCVLEVARVHLFFVSSVKKEVCWSVIWMKITLN